MKKYDIFYTQLKTSIIAFYDNEYCGDVDTAKELHLNLLDNRYERGRFEKAKNLYEERSRFLEELQDEMSKINDL